MSIHTLHKRDHLEIQDILKSRFFLRFLQKYQQRYHDGKIRKYKNTFIQGKKSSFSQDFFDDIESIFGNTAEFQNFCAEFREEMLKRPKVWQNIQAEYSDEEFILGILTFLKLYYKMGEVQGTMQDIFKIKVRDILQESRETVNDINGLNMCESFQIARENDLFPIDSSGEIITFLSKNGDTFEVFRQLSDTFAQVDKTGKIIKTHTPEIDILGENLPREELLARKEQFELFLKIYKAFSGQLNEEVHIATDDLDVYGDLVEKWIDTQEALHPQEGINILLQENKKWGKLFQKFLENSIEKLEQKTKRAQLQIIK